MCPPTSVVLMASRRASRSSGVAVFKRRISSSTSLFSFSIALIIADDGLDQPQSAYQVRYRSIDGVSGDDRPWLRGTTWIETILALHLTCPAYWFRAVTFDLVSQTLSIFPDTFRRNHNYRPFAGGKTCKRTSPGPALKLSHLDHGPCCASGY